VPHSSRAYLSADNPSAGDEKRRREDKISSVLSEVESREERRGGVRRENARKTVPSKAVADGEEEEERDSGVSSHDSRG
jgi:hypothetical protein